MQREEETQVAAAMRAGFTLIEILVAVAIIGILGTVATVSIPRILENNKIKAAKMGVDNLKAAVVTYNIEKGKYPSDLKALVDASGDDGAVVDGKSFCTDVSVILAYMINEIEGGIIGPSSEAALFKAEV